MSYDGFLDSIPPIKRDCSQCPSQANVLPQTKCCTFQPIVANYLLGESLSENKNVRENLKSKNVLLTSLGVAPSANYRNKFNLIGKKQYGQNINLLCSFYRDGICEIYSSRNFTCRSYFCLQTQEQINTVCKLQEKAFDYEMKMSQLIAVELGAEWSDIENSLNYINENTEVLNNLVTVEFYVECFQHYKVNKERLVESINNG